MKKWAQYKVTGVNSVWGHTLYCSNLTTATAMANYYGKDATIEKIN